MIHQKDLRLGDLVQITVDLPEYKQGDIFVVIDISEIYIGLRSPSESDCRQDLYTIRDYIEGILLTPEILEKNGWNKGQVYFRHSRIPRIKLCTDEDGTKWSVSINGDIMGDYIFYVHQLQHILFAFRIEEEMEV